MLLAMIVLTGLGALSALTVITVQSGSRTTSADRFHSIAVYAAESGGAAAMNWMRENVDPTLGWSGVMQPNNTELASPSDILGNNVLPGATGNPFSDDINAWYRVEIMNNKSDSGYSAGDDTDRRAVIRVTGHGPDGAIAIIEWDVMAGTDAAQRPCTGYAQENLSEDNSGANECLRNINTAGGAVTYTP